MEIVIRIAIIYLLLLVVLRLMGKREFSEMSPMEFVTLMLIPEIVAQALIDEDYSLTGGVVGICTLLSLVFAGSAISYRFKKAEKTIEGISTLLVENGRFIQENADRERISIDELFSELHKQGYTSLQEMRWVIIEPDGKLAFIPRQPPARNHTEEHHLT